MRNKKMFGIGAAVLMILVPISVVSASASNCNCDPIKSIDNTREPISNTDSFDDCFATCLGGIICSAQCLYFAAACALFPVPFNPACIGAMGYCGVALGLILACAITCAGGGCFLAKTQVMMADRSQKNIEDIQVGDIVLSFDKNTYKLVDGTVTEVYHHSADEMGGSYLIVNGKLEVTPNHLMLMGDYLSWKNAGDLVIGDIIATLDGGRFVDTIVEVFDQVPVYHIEVESDGIYFVDAIVVGPKPRYRDKPSESDVKPIVESKSVNLVRQFIFNFLQRFINPVVLRFSIFKSLRSYNGENEV